ncbi:hypothetical protein pb186bvf_014572 [Paramecium bursaria]
MFICCQSEKKKEQIQPKLRRIYSVMDKQSQSHLDETGVTQQNNPSDLDFQNFTDIMNNTEYYVKSQLFNIVEDSVEFDMNDEEYKTEVNDNNLLYEGEGLLLKITNIEDTRKKKIDSYQAFIMRIYQQDKEQFKLSPQQEVKFTKLVVSSFISEQVIRRAKQDSILVAHDPTGSFLIKHLFQSQAVYYLEESTTYTQIINKAVSTLNFRHKLFKVLKSELTDRIDTALVNLLYYQEQNLSQIIIEYMNYAHDLILIINPTVEQHQIISEFKKALPLSKQSSIYCGIELQNIWVSNKVIAKIVYYGEVSKISQNEQLNFLYKHISCTVRSKYKIKAIIKELRGMIGIMQLIKLFAELDLLLNNSEENFHRFYKLIKRQYFPTIKSQKFLEREENQFECGKQSSTESEDSDKEIGSIDVITCKVYSKSDYANGLHFDRSRISHMINFHSENVKSSRNTQEN